MGHFCIQTHDQLTLSAYEWPSIDHPKTPKAVLILLHGLAEHSGRYDQFAQFYRSNGMAVISMDLRGHGISEGIHVFLPTAEALFQDIDRLIDAGKCRYPSSPLILYGHSMGGTLALSYHLNRYSNPKSTPPYRGIIVSSPWIRLARFHQSIRPIFSLVRIVSRWYPSFRIPLRFDPRIISRDEQIVAEYAEDPYIRRSATLSMTHMMGALANRLDRCAANFRLPVLVQHGTADQLTCHQASEAFAKRGSNIDYQAWPNCYHELHHELEREKIFAFSLDWISRKILS